MLVAEVCIDSPEAAGPAQVDDGLGRKPAIVPAAGLSRSQKSRSYQQEEAGLHTLAVPVVAAAADGVAAAVCLWSY